MLKKPFVFVTFLMFFAGISAAAQESNLTPRQLLLLQVPDGWGIELDNMSWAVVFEDGQPKERIIYGHEDAVDVISVFENKVEKFVRLAIVPSPTGKTALIPAISGVSENNSLVAKDMFSETLGVAGIPQEILQKVCDDIVSEAKIVLDAFGIETDEKLAKLIKKSVTDKKATDHL